MEDQQIVDLYFSRNEDAIVQTDRKYGRYCFAIANNILTNEEDAEESVSDTYMAAWKAMPPSRPAVLSTFLGKLTRRISIDRWRARSAYKRGGGEITLALEELKDCASVAPTPEEDYQRKELVRAYIRFLDGLSVTDRRVFLRRYWYLDSVEEIARQFGFSQTHFAVGYSDEIRSEIRVSMTEYARSRTSFSVGGF